MLLLLNSVYQEVHLGVLLADPNKVICAESWQLLGYKYSEPLYL